MTDIEKPYIVIDPTASPDITCRIKAIETAVHDHPEAFLRALGGLSLGNSLELAELDKRTPVATKDPEALLQELLVNRYDLEYTYDDTEDTLAADPTYQQLLHLIRERKGGAETRDQARIYRLGHFLTRAVNWQALPKQRRAAS